MPTYDRTETFLRDWARLTPEQHMQFKLAVKQLVADIKAGGQVRASLGIKRFHRRPDLWEFAWAPNGRALFTYGTSPHPGDVHIIWERVGTHDIYKR